MAPETNARFPIAPPIVAPVDARRPIFAGVPMVLPAPLAALPAAGAAEEEEEEEEEGVHSSVTPYPAPASAARPSREPAGAPARPAAWRSPVAWVRLSARSAA